MNYNTELQANNTDLQTILNSINELPEASGGVELPALSNPASSGQILNGYEAIDENGEKITGTITTQAAKTVTPSTENQIAVAKGVYTTGIVTVGAIPNDYIVTEEITAQDNLISQIQTALQTKASGSEPILQSKTVSPTPVETIVKPDSGYDGLFQVTVKGDANLSSSNIKKDISIFGVTGTYEGDSSTETWVFTMEDGSSVEKDVVVS